MNLETLSLFFRALLLGGSFVGLCATARSALRLNRFIAPFFVASGIVVGMMLAGMLNILPYGFAALYLAGFAGLISTYGLRRVRPDWAMVGLLVAFVAALSWRLYPLRIARSDDVSHWALVARHMLRNDAFPDASTRTVLFQSYPLGSAAFIYYVGRTLENAEGVWLIASDFLTGVAFLPVLAHMRGRRGLWPAALGAFGFLFFFVRRVGTLQVDWMLGFFGVGMAASAGWECRDWRRAALAVAPAMLASVYIKSSGLCFAALGALCVACVAGKESGRAAFWKAFLAGMGAAVAAYALWTLHVRLAFPAGMSTKHAVSLSAYAREAASKDARLIARIARQMLRRLLHPGATALAAMAFAAGCGCACAWAWRKPALRGAARQFRNALLFAVAAYAAWQLMLFWMYICSMPAGEARRLASYARYNGTAIVLLVGMTVTALFDFACAWNAHPSRRALRAYAGAWAAAAVALALLFAAHPRLARPLLDRDAGYCRQRACLRAARDALDLQPGAKVMVYWRDSANRLPAYTLFYYVKYEYDAVDVCTIVHHDREPAAEGEYEFAEVRPLASVEQVSDISVSLEEETSYGDDPAAYVAAHIEAYDALIVADADPALAEFLRTYAGDTPIYRACE